MSHFLTYVVTEAPDDDEVERLLAPYDENGEWFADDSRWDWWVVGGRFSGSLDGYDPEKDPANVETCRVCGGTGRREDAERFEAESPGWIEATNGCNGCDGKGESLKWPTQWAEHDGDRFRAVGEVLARLREPVPEPVAALAAVGGWAERERLYESFSADEQAQVAGALRVPLAVVTPDGKWHEQARMGWWGVTIPDEEGNEEEKAEQAWRATVGALLEQYPDALVTVVDCHV